MLGRREGKKKRWLALLLAGVMVLSGMGTPSAVVRAEEGTQAVESAASTSGNDAVDGADEQTPGEQNTDANAQNTADAQSAESGEKSGAAEAQPAAVTEENAENDTKSEGKYTFDAADDETISKLDKKATVPEGKYGTDGYFVFSGSVIRGNSGTFSAEIGKSESGEMSFTISGKACAVFNVTSTGSSNKSDFTLINGEGKKVLATGETEEIIVVEGTIVKEIKYENLEAGTYRVCAPKDGENSGRGFRLLSATVEDIPVSVTKQYIFDAATDETINKLDKKAAVPEGKYGTDGYFVFSGSVIRGNSGTFSAEIGKSESGDMSFTISGKADATFNVTSTGSSNKSDFTLINGEGKKVLATGETEGIIVVEGTTVKEIKYENLEAGTYRVIAPKDGENSGRGFRLLSAKVSDTVGGSRPERAEWNSVKAPVLNNASQVENKNDIEVKISSVVGYDGADVLVVSMLDEEGNVVKEQSVAKDGAEHTATFTPTVSGKYTFKAVAKRDGENDKASEETITVDFLLKLEQPVISSVTNTGAGSVSVEWNEVAEAEKYIVTVNGTTIKEEVTDAAVILKGLTIGATYTVSVVAVRGTEVTKAGTMEVKVVDDVQRVWSVSTYGSSTDSKNNGVKGNINDGTVTVFSEGGKGKIVPGSTDGLTYYYTKIDPKTENFTLTATVKVDKWTLSNGQEGFGMMVSDTVGPNGDGTAFWNNCFQNIVTKIEYNWDGEAVTNDTTAPKISMKLGLGTIARTGVTAADVAAIKAGTITMPAGYVSTSSTLETSAAALGAGTYNVVGNYTGTEPTGTLENLITEFRLQIQRNNTGYILRYLDENDNVISEKLFYDIERTELTKLDPDNIYVGFFASRNARITVTDAVLTTIHPEEDAPAEKRKIEQVYPINTIESAAFANSADYDLVYYGNADGTLVVKDADGSEIVNKEFKAASKEHIAVKLNAGRNVFDVTFIPDPDYRPGAYAEMTAYDTVNFQYVVEYKTSVRSNIYVSPDGKAGAAGTKEAPVDIYSAVKTAAPGQKIILKEGTYNLTKTVKVERGINGTPEAMIYMIADPESSSRPVLDFGGNCAGMILAGDYWYFQGFDVTRSADAQKGIQVSGNHNTLDQIHAYRNGNTGVQISRYLSTDGFEQWPAYNLILNCSSYLNADKGYEDADGFAAKLTVGDGNVFDGCISAYNADDGWDLFAKVQTGSIGSVTIQNCIAFKNGYILDKDGKEVDAGNGNGFKMGGDSMPGAHVLKDSIAFSNKAKGIDSNSCPDIKVYNSTSYDNESYNVAFYTNTAVNTAFYAEGILSYKTSNKVAEQYKPKGTQKDSDVNNASNYYFNGSKSVNSEEKEADASWFTNLDVKTAINGGIARNADGTLNTNGFLTLTEKAPEGVGAVLGGQASKVIKPSEEKTSGENGSTNKQPENTSNSGNNSNGGSNSDGNSGNAGETDNVVQPASAQTASAQPAATQSAGRTAAQNGNTQNAGVTASDKTTEIRDTAPALSDEVKEQPSDEPKQEQIPIEKEQVATTASPKTNGFPWWIVAAAVVIGGAAAAGLWFFVGRKEEE